MGSGTTKPHIRPLDTLGLHLEALQLIRQILKGKPGLILVAGPPGSGKSTVLGSLAREIGLGDVTVALLDDTSVPSEDYFALPPDWKVIPCGPSHESWVQGIQAATKLEEGAIVLGTLRYDVLRRAIAATRDCRWILSCVDTPFAGIDVLQNLRASGISSSDLAARISGIVSQILLSRLCGKCSFEAEAGIEDTRLIFPEASKSLSFRHARGCSACEDRGTKGKVPAFEVVVIDDSTREGVEAYLDNNELAALSEVKRVSVLEYARQLVKEGLVGIETYRREIFQNPLLRTQHMLEQEHSRADRIKGLFSRFVTHQIAERVISDADAEKIMEGEKRKVTCLFADIRGFTPIAEVSTPLEVFRLLNDYFGDIIDIVFAHEGTIDKFVGDQIMVVFGAPLAQEDQEIRAVNCAIQIQRKIATINENRPGGRPPVAMGIGVNTGEAVAGCIGNEKRTDYTVLGDTVNVASRLEGKAQPGEILIGHETFTAVCNAIECRETGPFTLKGKAEPVSAYSVVY